MKVPFTPQLLGDLIEKGYTYMLASIAFEEAITDKLPVVLKPVKEQPVLPTLPEGYQTFYRITREPLQMVAGIDETEILLDYETTHSSTGSDVYNDSYFRMSEEFFRQVLDSLEDYAVITTDTNGDVNSWNRGAEKVLGFAEQEILGLSADVFFTPEDCEKGVPEMELSNALHDGRAIDERYHMRKDGSRFWGSGLVFPLYDESHKHRGFTKIMRNLREEENARQTATD
ncbi:MAG: PAS domain S-box protein [Sphingobacteriaceae bacterium]|nr:MAG: PAS domain S-box protein [Sphingobacteriaceae bacterium]